MSDKHHFRPRLEFLDDRIVPGFGSLNLGWTDGTGGGLFQTAANWRNLATGATSIRPPAAGDRLTFDGSLTNDSLTNLHGFNLDETTADYLSISINNYSGTVTIAPDSTAGLATSNFTLASGAISQPVTGTDLTVLSNFTWTGGTLNSSTNVANVTISGSSATVAPAGGGTVNLGSTLNLSGGAVATMGAGTLNITNDGVNFNINANSGMLVDPGALNTFTVAASFTIVNGVQLNIAEQAWVKAVSGAWLNATPAKNMGGSLILRPDTHVSFLGHVDNVANGPSIQQTAGVIYLYPGSILETNNEQVGTLMSGGALSIQLDEGGTDPAEITGNLKIIGGDIVSGANANGDTHLFGELRVEGNVTWLGGTYRPYLNAAADWDSDVWHVTGTFTIGGTAALAPVAVDAENNPLDLIHDSGRFVRCRGTSDLFGFRL